jgi:uncharacterized membrane protein
MRDTLYVLAASYDEVEDALAEYEAIEVAWRHVSSSHDFDATVVAKDETGKVQIVRRHDEPTRHGSATGLAWGLAAGAVAALFPPWESWARSRPEAALAPRWARWPATPAEH